MVMMRNPLWAALPLVVEGPAGVQVTARMRLEEDLLAAGASREEHEEDKKNIRDMRRHGGSGRSRRGIRPDALLRGPILRQRHCHR
jgi:hypothetical protein